jgi:predicted HAD superfamily phosphohydrolase YqeG
MRPFSEVAFESLEPKTILIDVDGTLMSDGEREVSAVVRERVRAIGARHELYVCTNNRSQGRTRAVACDLGIPLIETAYRKPDPRVTSGLSPKYPLLVVGDKFLTDRLFALAVGAEFICVARDTSPKDRFAARVAYLFDDAVSALVNAMNRRT